MWKPLNSNGGNRFRCVWWEGASSGRETSLTTTYSTPGCHIIKTFRKRVLSAFIYTGDNRWRTSTISELFYLQKRFCIKVPAVSVVSMPAAGYSASGIYSCGCKIRSDAKIRSTRKATLLNSILSIFSQIRLCFTTRIICYFYLLVKTQFII